MAISAQQAARSEPIAAFEEYSIKNGTVAWVTGAWRHKEANFFRVSKQNLSPTPYEDRQKAGAANGNNKESELEGWILLGN